MPHDARLERFRLVGRPLLPDLARPGRLVSPFRRLQDGHDLVPTAIACADVGHRHIDSAGSGGSNQNRPASLESTMGFLVQDCRVKNVSPWVLRLAGAAASVAILASVVIG